jgi:type VI secretion system secreted protein Hcp
MPGNAFITFFDDKGKMAATGESQQKGHEGEKGWIEIGDWSWDVEAEASHLKGTGAAVGKPTPGAFSWSHFYDKSSPTIMQTIVKGTHFDKAQIDLLKQTGKDMPEIFMQIIMRNVFITKVGSKGGEDGQVSQDIEMTFNKIGLCYKKQLNTGALSTKKDFRWNVSEMTLESSDISFTI